MVFEQLAPVFSDTQVEAFLIFLFKDQALGDRSAEVCRNMLNAGTAIVDQHGATRITSLLMVFEDHLASPGPPTETGNQIKEAVVILFGRAAWHLDASDRRIRNTVDRLVEALKTPAEQVQVAVSDCLVPLVRFMGNLVDAFIDHLLEELLNAPKYAAHREAAYGLAGVIKGLGIGSLKRFELHQGTMFAFEMLSSTLGRLFELYIMLTLPILLTAVGDGTADVRKAAQGSIELLGMMACCSPRQLTLSFRL